MMECIILAGGLGTRLRSVVADIPKCMAPVSGQPFLYYLLNYLEKQNVHHVILSVGYKHEIIVNWINTYNWSFDITFSIESEPLGTGGAIKLALEKSREKQVLIVNGDTFFDVDLNKLYQFHKDNNSDLTIALKTMNRFDRYGNVIIDSNKRIINFNEKQYCEEGQINGGIYLLNNTCELMDQSLTKFSFENEVLQKKYSVYAFYGFIQNGYFIDIGIPEDHERADTEFKTMFL